MSIIRVRKDERYFSASNEPFNDKRLSWESRGLMGYLLSKPNNWEIRQTDLEQQGPAGEHKLRRMLAELRKCGYMNRIRFTNPDGTFGWTTEVFESPSQNPKPNAKVTTRRFSTSGSSTSGKPPHIVITDLYDEEYKAILKKWESLHGFINTSHAKLIGDLLDTWREHKNNLKPEHPNANLNNYVVFSEAMEITAKNADNPFSVAYLETVIQNWIEKGYGWKPKNAKKNGKQETPTPQPEIIRAPENPTPIISPEKLRAAREKAGL